MQEFTSISVSSYEADTLAALLNEKSGDGWDVVAIVPTGSTVTAYLSKDKSEASAASESTASAEDQPTDKAADDTTTDDRISDDRISDDETAAVPAAAAASATTPADEDKPVVDPLTVGAASAVAASAANDKVNADTGGEPAKSAVDEPAGWAVGATGAGAAASNPTPATAATTTASTPGAAATSAPAAAAAAASSTPSAAAAPAGWYADPSSRYELRYWDGSQWTEHVSRAGQQFTDPPVA